MKKAPAIFEHADKIPLNTLAKSRNTPMMISITAYNRYIISPLFLYHYSKKAASRAACKS